MSAKKRAMTIKEQVATALVPEEAQPYKVPENWCWVHLGSVVSFSSEKQETFTGDELYIGLEHMRSGQGITDYGSTEGLKSTKNVFHPGQVLYGKLRPYLNKHDLASFDGVCSTDILVLDASTALLPEFLNLYLGTKGFIEFATSHSKGSSLPRTSAKEIGIAPLPLPPIHEQQRITSCVKRIFSKLEKAETDLLDVINCVDKQQQAILHKTFSKSDAAWNKVRVGDVVSGLKYGTSEKSTYENEGMPVLRIPNVSQLRVDLTDMKYLPRKDVNADDLVRSGDLLMIRSNGSRELVGRCAVVPELDKEYAYASFLIRIRPSDRVDSRYLWYFLQSPDAKSQLFTKAKSSSGIHNINSKEISATVMPLPSMEEQVRLVKSLDDLLEKNARIIDSAQAAIDEITKIKQSSLSKAMRGELGSNDLSEQSSVSLLRRIFEANS